MKISLLNRRSDTSPRVVDIDWPGIEAILATSRTLQLKADEYARLNKAAQGEMKDGPAWIPGESTGGRTDAGIVSVCALVLDFDAMQRQDVERLWQKLDGCRLTYAAHTSASHRAEHPKWRAVIPLATPIEAKAWKERWYAGVSWLGLRGRLAPDTKANNPARLYYLPTHLEDCLPEWRTRSGRALELDSVPSLPTPKPRPAPTIQWHSDNVTEQARRYLKKMGPAIEGSGGNALTFKAACVALRDFGLSEAIALDVLREWNATCSPPWDDDGLLEMMRHAAKYGKTAIGVRRNAFRRDGTMDPAAVKAFFEQHIQKK